MPSPARTDCLVVGAGLIGLSTALHLRWRGLSVRVVERGRIGDGTSSKASGWISAQLRTPNPLLELVLASQAYYPELLERIGDACGYERCGSLVALESEEGLEQRRLLDEEQRKVPSYAGARFLDARAVRELEPAIAESIVAGAYFADDAQIDPQRMLPAMVRTAEAAGVAVHQGADVRAASRAGGEWLVTTTIGAFTAGTLVNAAGAWAPELAEQTGVALPILPVAGQLLVSRPRSGVVRHCVVSQPDARFATRMACGIRPALDGRLWMGTTYRAGTFDCTITTEDTDAIASAVGELYPALRGVELEQAWAGVRPVPADLLPAYGRVSGVEDYFVAVPIAGLAEAAIAGRLMAALVAGDAPPLDAAPFAPDRLADA